MGRALFIWLSVAALMVTACGPGDGEPGQQGDSPGAAGTAPAAEEAGGGADGVVTLWSIENQPDRVANTEEILARFTEETDIPAEVVPVNEDELPELMAANAAAGTLPDVVYHPIELTAGWAEQGLLDVEAAGEVVESLGRDTFAETSLDLVTVDGNPAAVPSDVWGQLIVYRTDLFEEAGLEPPTTFERIREAAETLHDPSQQLFGFAGGTVAGGVYTQHAFEHFALGNGCRLLDEGGNVALDSPECSETLEFYTDLVGQFGPPGAQDFEETRAAYFAGQAAMVQWSPFILDELAGLRDDALPTCPECADDPQFLAENSGMVGAIAGPSGSPSQYGAPQYLGIGTDTDTEEAQRFLEFFLTDGYLDWLSVAPEGKFPFRHGTTEAPEEFVEGWGELEVGVDRRTRLVDVYGDEILDVLTEGTTRFDRWGFERGGATLVTTVYESLVVPQVVRDVLDGTLSVEDGTAELQAEIESLRS